jgi:arginyl-tRNA synthetase
VIPADLDAELAAAIGELVAAGRLPGSTVGLSAAGTWRLVPAAAAPAATAPDDRAGRPAARYSTSLPFELARLAGQEPVAVAARLGRIIQRAGWITVAEPTGAGYLSIGVTAAALAAVAVRIRQAGPACVRSDALRSVSRPVPPLPDLAAALSWRQAWRDQAAALAGRLAEAAGATVLTPVDGPPPIGPPARDGPASGATVADAAEFVGADAVRYWLARRPAARAGALGVRRLEAQPYSAPPYLSGNLAAVRFAAADAAATGRWATELGLARVEPLEAGHLGQPAEIALLSELSWLAERVAGAARRRQPHELPRYLEQLAGAWLDCRENCPALPFGGRGAPGTATGISARLWLAEAAATALAAGLDLVGIRAVMTSSGHL